MYTLEIQAVEKHKLEHSDEIQYINESSFALFLVQYCGFTGLSGLRLLQI